MKLVKDLLSLLSKREHWQLALLLIAMIVQAAAEMAGIASVGPFMSTASEPATTIESNAWLRWAYDAFGFASYSSFLIACGIGVIAVLLVTNSISALVLWAQLRFAAGAQHRLSVRLVRGYMTQPYSFFAQRNTSDLHTNVLEEVNTVIRGVLKPILNIIARSFTTLAIVAFLVYLDPVLAFIIAVVLGGAYTLIYVSIKVKQRNLGRKRLKSNQQRFRVSGELFGGIKDVKVLQREESFLKQFKPASHDYVRTSATHATITGLPRYFLETIAFGGIVVIVLYYLNQGQGASEVLPMLSLYAFAGYRLLPSLQMLFASMALLRFNQAALDNILDDMSLFDPQALSGDEDHEALPFKRRIRFEKVRFRYPNATEDALKGISLQVNHNETVGLVGSSGSGKTTLVDLLLGLYRPHAGSIAVDDEALDASSVSKWRRQVGYIPQSIFLTDASIAHNIAFGVPNEDIDMERVEEAARVAHLHSFVQTLSDQYHTVVGERGVRLSGGQRQRIGIARALYHDPEVLIMDEATSALDGVTEDAVMEAIRELAGKKTIILIAHRISTVRDCDCIFMLENGRVKEQGTYNDLTSQSEAFRALAKLKAH